MCANVCECVCVYMCVKQPPKSSLSRVKHTGAVCRVTAIHVCTLDASGMVVGEGETSTQPENEIKAMQQQKKGGGTQASEHSCMGGDEGRTEGHGLGARSLSLLERTMTLSKP